MTTCLKPNHTYNGFNFNELRNWNQHKQQKLKTAQKLSIEKSE